MKANQAIAAGAISVAALVLAAAPLSAASKRALQPNRVVVEYQPAKTPEHQTIEESLKQNQILERVAGILAPVKLPRRLTLRTMACDGNASARYEDDAIRLCYEYIERLLMLVKDQDLPPGITRRNLLVGMMADAFFHEFGHAVFDMLKIPVFGREEDAADQFSAYVMLQFSKHDAWQMIAGAAFYFARGSMQRTSPPGLDDYSNEHGLPAQRFFNYICLAYGSDPELFAAAIDEGKLSKTRAQSCAGEYKQVERAFRRLILPFVDKRVLARVRAKEWFALDLVHASAID
jgi:hypothetical protein